jgi:Domain of unknown function (DUF4350)
VSEDQSWSESSDSISNPRRFGGISAFLLALLLIGGIIGNVSRPLASLTGLFLLLVFMLVYTPAVSAGVSEGSGRDVSLSLSRLVSGRRFQTYAALVVLYLASATLVLTRNRAAGMLGLALLVFGLDLIGRRTGEVRRELAPLLLTIILYSLYLLLLAYVPPFWRLMNGASLLLSNGVGRLIGRQVNLAATYSGLHIVALFALYFISALAFSRKRRPQVVVGLFASLLAGYVVYILAWSLIYGSSLPRRVLLAGPFVTNYYFWLLLFVLLLVPTFMMLRRARFREVRVVPVARDLKRVVPAIVLLLLAVPLLALQPAGAARSRKVVLFDTGRLDWSVPDYYRLGLKNTGMFGVLPDYLSERGYPASLESELTEQTLKGAGTLVLINLDRKLDSREKATVWQFVRDGGSLLVLGDHTGREFVREPYNDLLGRVGIAFAFDSAIPVTARWEGGGFELKPHPIFDGISEEELQINIGASLRASGAARPLVVGRYGYSDKGNALAADNGFLGDMKYSADERLGDLVLAADARYGRGKVLAFGDTSSFQNGALTESYRFVDNVFAWLSSSGGGWYPYNVIIAVVLLAASLVLLLLDGCSVVSLMGFAAAIALALLVASAGSGVGRVDHGRLSRGPALIDMSHLEQFSEEPFKSGSLDGLTANLMRNGYMPLMMKRFSPDLVLNARIFVVVAPASSFSPSEIKTVNAFVSGGGVLMVTSGYEESEGSKSLLADFGMSVGDTPLGRVTTDSAIGSTGVDLWKAWPVVVEQKSISAEVLAQVWGYPIIQFRPFGRGGVIVAGDSSFLQNKNLEEQSTYNESNVYFLKEFFGKFKEAGIRN